MNNIFQSVLARKPQSSAFNLSHSRKFSFAPGMLYPTLCMETMPSDKIHYNTNALVRFQPLVYPTMHLMDVYTYSFRVPTRLCVQRGKWETFITGGNKGDGKDAQGNTIAIPYVRFGVGTSTATFLNVTALDTGSLADYLGIGQIDATGADTFPLNFMPFIAFWRIWNEYFRDQNLHPDYVGLYPGIFDAYGNITAAVFAAQNDATNPFRWWEIPAVCWEKDFFTSALSTAQRGQPVQTPLTGTATVTYKTQAIALKPGTAAAGQLRAGTAVNAPIVHAQGVDGAGTTTPVGIDNIDNVQLTSGGFTINALRLAARLQEWMEKMARGGARYIEQIKQHFGVTSSDARLQRPEMLGGGKIPVTISEVLQTSESGTTPQGEMAGHGIAAGKITGWHTFFEEHAYVISIMFLRPRTAYQQGIPRLFYQRFDKLDWPWPSFAHLGEQEVKMMELYASTNGVENEKTFGYQQRYAELKYIPSTVHGQFRTTLAPWHWGRIFATRPTLSKDFVECHPSDRIFNVLGTGDSLYAIVSNQITGIRPLPYYSEPTI